MGLTYGPITSSIDDKKARRRMYNTSATDITKLKCGPSIKEGGSSRSLFLIANITSLAHTLLII